MLYAKLICVRLSFDSIRIEREAYCFACVQQFHMKLMAPIQSTSFVSVLSSSSPVVHTHINNHLLTHCHSLPLCSGALFFSRFTKRNDSKNNFSLASSTRFDRITVWVQCVCVYEWVWMGMLYAHAFVCLHFYLSIFVYWLGECKNCARNKNKPSK